jgi:hypothetical protein
VVSQDPIFGIAFDMIRLNSDTATETIVEEGDHDEEVRVTFYPPLVLQRRMWILDILRTENVTKVYIQLIYGNFFS